MKKNAAIGVLLFFSVSLCFAKAQRENLEIGGGYNYTNETFTYSGITYKTTTPSYAINFAGSSYFTKIVGIGAYANFLFPQKFVTESQGQSMTANRSDYDFLFGTDLLIGPVFMLYDSKTFSLPFAVGVHGQYLWSLPYTSGAQIGAGANITGQIHFNPTVYLYGRFQFSFDFYSWSWGRDEVSIGNWYSAEKSSFSGRVTTWGIAPCIGIGFSW